MKDLLVNYMNSERRNILKKCTQCGLCIKKCPIIKNTELKNIDPENIQKEVIKFLQEGIPNEIVYNRGFSCMECFGCIDDCCPQRLNPMLINEMIKWDYRRHNLINCEYSDPKDKNSLHRIIASVQINHEDYDKLLTSSPSSKSDYVFFPGCNVYFQPEKLLSGLDILDIIDKEWAFVSGLDFCCGESHIGAGAIEEADSISAELIDKLASYTPKAVIFWCPTCLCRFEKTLAPAMDIPFKMISFPEFLRENLDSLSFKKELNKTVTLHEACKSAFTGLDLNGTRDILKKLPGVSLVEMPRHGKNTSCCGSGAVTFFKDSFDIVRRERMDEAAETKADLLVNVCHYCHEVFTDKEQNYNYSVVNYISLIAEALGIEREDKLKKYKQLNDVYKILDYVKNYIEHSPFSKEKIIESLQTIIE
ncbi:(Fe-S)-binding protein [uncultured Ilyobacter sp.]|uniref:(Fe-S)-binding protein n=1 Tax=uncultured Ilyobacter sp. TaxID=544433 RepID=UPI0029BFF1C4|nr:(Fe-S)-binding protein [uncultured Ilyobacter sp.]